jgi:TPR repeat protein
MKAISLIFPFVLVVTSSFAQDVYRKIGDQFYDIRQPGWFNSDTFDNPILVSHVVDQVLPDGILVHEVRFNGAIGGSVEDKQCFITNYPAIQTVSDNQKIHFLAMRTGNYHYKDTSGAMRTVPMYDCGIPYNAQAVNAILHPPLTPEQKEAQAQARAAKKLAAQQAIIQNYTTKADGGDGFAQYRIGEIYFRGEGVETNLVYARHYLSMAVTNGYPEATNYLNQIK